MCAGARAEVADGVRVWRHGDAGSMAQHAELYQRRILLFQLRRLSKMQISNELHSKLENALEKTGFPLENFVCNHLEKIGWYAIGGRYYCDDIDGKAREIDILSYKIRKGKFVDVCSVLLISCKKDHSNSWVFLSKGKPKKDPNYRWDPVFIFSSNPLIDSLQNDEDFCDQYRDGMGVLKNQIIEVDKNVFAFQLVRDDSPQNDKPIFGSIESLIKAREHERKSLKNKLLNKPIKKKRRVYVFNLVTVVDAEMYEAHYVGKDCSIKKTEEVKYLARYIVDKEDVVARIHFVSKSNFERALKKYDSLSGKELIFFDGKISDAYLRWWESPQKEIFQKNLAPKIRDLIESHVDEIDEKSFDFFFDLSVDENGGMEIGMLLNENELERLTRARGISRRISRLLRDELNYEGVHALVESPVPF